ncbi:MAG: hypothetical protein ACC645_23180, partial [Pirellulales bacterium]
MRRLALHWQILIAMVVGAVAGILLNATAGTYTTVVPVAFHGGSIHLHGMARSVDVPAGTIWVQDSPNEVLIQIQTPLPDGKPYSVRRVVVRGPIAASRRAEVERREQQAWPEVDASFVDQIHRQQVPLVDKLKSDDPAAYALFQMYGRSTARTVGDLSKAGGDLFLRMLK